LSVYHYRLKKEVNTYERLYNNIEDDTLKNRDFRRVLYTGKNSQLVLMSLRSKEEIGEETHILDQFIRVEAGDGAANLDGVKHRISMAALSSSRRVRNTTL
jgi:mannose-6-phosphate isomerase-like protein (cupin superfamily)